MFIFRSKVDPRYTYITNQHKNQNKTENNNCTQKRVVTVLLFPFYLLYDVVQMLFIVFVIGNNKKIHKRTK